MTSHETIKTCRYLRQYPTPAEELLWRHLRNKQLGGLKFRRQHPVAEFILDFYCPQLRLAIELDGGFHKEDETRKNDLERTRILNEKGIRVIRFWNSEVLGKMAFVLAKIQSFIDSPGR